MSPDHTHGSPLPLLRDVSRSFYLTLRVLPAEIRPQIGLAYLLARASDTIADTEVLPIADRLSALARFRDAVLNGSPARVDLSTMITAQGSPAERRLLERIDSLCSALGQFENQDQQRVRNVFAIITSGQELDLRRFSEARPDHIVALANAAELDDYTYRVAGCVGEFWTHMCRAHLFPSAQLDDAQLLHDGVRFGKGLQLINILRDIAFDLKMGRCYLPEDDLLKFGLTPRDLLDPNSSTKLRSVYDACIDQAEDHLSAGWRYTLALPFSQWRVRLACAWPILIGIETLNRLRHANVLDPAQRVKITRKHVRSILIRSILAVPFPCLWRRLFRLSL